MSQHKPTIAVYGATSFTAKNHMLPYLAEHADASKFHLILAGRSADKLEAVNAALPTGSGDAREVLSLQLDDEGAVEKLVQRADVVVNFAGPYQKHNAEALIASCVHHGKGYLDLCGEVNWLARMIPKYDFQASKTGAVVVPMCGFEATPGDIVVYHALRALQGHAGKSRGIKAATNFYDIAGGVSGGTLASVEAMADALASSEQRPEMAGKRPEDYALLPTSYSTAHTTGAHRPSPVVHGPVKVAGAPSLGAFFVGSVCNVPTIYRSSYLSRIDPKLLREASDDEPVHGPQSTFSEALWRYRGSNIGANSVTAWLVGFVCMVGVLIWTSSKWVRDVFANRIPQPGEGPSDAECAAGHTRLTNVALADGGPNGDAAPLAVVTTYEAKGDPGYYHTGRILAEAALSLILPPPKGTSLPPLSRTGGVLTPSTAMGMVLVERMRINGVAKIESNIVELGRNAEAKKTI